MPDIDVEPVDTSVYRVQEAAREAERLSGLIIRPGDTLILRYDSATRLTRHDAEIVRDLVRERLGIECVIITADGFAVYRTDD